MLRDFKTHRPHIRLRYGAYGRGQSPYRIQGMGLAVMQLVELHGIVMVGFGSMGTSSPAMRRCHFPRRLRREGELCPLTATPIKTSAATPATIQYTVSLPNCGRVRAPPL